ncbi:MAG: hypothetical protein DRN03_02165 [Thermoplasmata archaeon]|nr:MAG: hypothetical protein DRN03_02165 [Thermoplasmata archaeon]
MVLKRSRVGYLFSSSVSRVVMHLPFHPNLYTFLSVLLAISGMVVSLKNLPLAFTLFCLSFLMDVADGAAARINGASSLRGAFNDGIADRIVETFVIITLAFFDIPTFLLTSKIWLMILLAFGTYMTSFIKAYAVHHGVIQRGIAEEMPGLMERGERALFLLGILFLIMIDQKLYAGVLLVLSSVLAVLTAIQRYLYVIRRG